MLIVLIIFIILPSIFTFAVSHISANKLQYLRYQIKQVRRERERRRENIFQTFFRVSKMKRKISRQCNKTEALRLSSEDESMFKRGEEEKRRKKNAKKLCIHVRPSLKHHITS